jgi:hypothetical protein
MGEMSKKYMILVGKPERISLGGPKCTLEDDIRMDLRE